MEIYFLSYILQYFIHYNEIALFYYSKFLNKIKRIINLKLKEII